MFETRRTSFWTCWICFLQSASFSLRSEMSSSFLWTSRLRPSAFSDSCLAFSFSLCEQDYNKEMLTVLEKRQGSAHRGQNTAGRLALPGHQTILWSDNKESVFHNGNIIWWYNMVYSWTSRQGNIVRWFLIGVLFLCISGDSQQFQFNSIVKLDMEKWSNGVQ